MRSKSSHPRGRKTGAQNTNMQPRDSRIRTYSVDGELCRPLLLEDLLRHEKEDRVVLRRGRNGNVLTAHYCHKHRRKPLTTWRNTTYTRRELMADRIVIEHKPLPWFAAQQATDFCGTPAQVEMALRLMFLQVMLSVRP